MSDWNLLAPRSDWRWGNGTYSICLQSEHLGKASCIQRLGAVHGAWSNDQSNSRSARITRGNQNAFRVHVCVRASELRAAFASRASASAYKTSEVFVSVLFVAHLLTNTQRTSNCAGWIPTPAINAHIVDSQREDSGRLPRLSVRQHSPSGAKWKSRKLYFLWTGTTLAYPTPNVAVCG